MHDGTIIEHGDGFMLAAIDLEDGRETSGIIIKSVAVADGLDILVGANESIMSNDFMIGWRDWKYTYEPLSALSEQSSDGAGDSYR